MSLFPFLKPFTGRPQIVAITGLYRPQLMNLLIILLLMPILTTPFRLPPSLHPSLHPPPSSTSLFISRARAADALLPWLVSQKGSSKSFTLTKTPKSNDIEIYATAPLESNTVVLSTPADLALTISDADSFPPPSLSAIPSSVYAELPWYSKMSLTLHALNSTDPNYAPWFASLPPPFLDTPFHWTTGQLLSLEYSPMNTAVLDQTRLWRGHYESVKQYIVPSLDFDSYVHNCELARSRMFSATKQPAFNPVPLSITLALVALTLSLHLGTVEQAANGATLILCATIFKDFVFPKFNKKTIYVLAPVCDMANHDATTPNCAVSFEYFQNSFSLATTSPIAANEELRISYGPRSNDQVRQTNRLMGGGWREKATWRATAHNVERANGALCAHMCVRLTRVCGSFCSTTAS